MKIMKFAAVLVLIGAMVGSPATATTYAVNDSAGFETVVGTITTNGKLGVLTVSDIVDWNLTLPSPLTLTPANSAVELSGDHLTATPTALLFDYTDAFPADYKLYFYSTGGVLQGWVTYATYGFNFQIGACDVGSICFGGAKEFRSGVGVIAGTADGTTPLPAALPLFATGLGALGLLGWRRKRKAQAAA
jgi:hypothetical protein